MFASRIFHFSAAHYLPNYQGKCSNLHGHNYKLVVTIRASKLDNQGMVMDFAEIKKKVKEVLDFFDHKCLNDIRYLDGFSVSMNNPTAENIILRLWKLIKNRIPRLHKLTLYESEDCYIEYAGEFAEGK